MKVLISKLRHRLWKAVIEFEWARRQEAPLRALNTVQLAEVRTLFKKPKFFIFGHARSGTTLLARLVRLHPEVHCNWQAHFFSQTNDLIQQLSTPGFQGWLDRRSNRWTYEQDLMAPIIRILCDYIMEREADRQGKRIVGDKTPNMNGPQAVQRLHKIYPDCNLINLVRDGRDAVLSRRIQSFINAKSALTHNDRLIMKAFMNDSQPFLNGERSIFDRTWLEEAAKTWVLNVRDGHAEAQFLYGDRSLSLKYEDLLLEPLEWMSKIWVFLGVDNRQLDLEKAIRDEMKTNPAADWHAEKAPDLVRNLRRGIYGNWHNIFTAEDLRIFENIAGEALAAWGYEVRDG